jgi:hypothetical protein
MEGLYMFEKMGKALTRADIGEIEVNLGLTFPEDFVGHYLSYNGGIPAKPFSILIRKRLKQKFKFFFH